MERSGAPRVHTALQHFLDHPDFVQAPTEYVPWPQSPHSRVFAE